MYITLRIQGTKKQKMNDKEKFTQKKLKWDTIYSGPYE